ncbi:SCO family protein [candidate division KSB1 bacterium]
MNNRKIFSGWLKLLVILFAVLGSIAAVVIHLGASSLTNLDVLGNVDEFAFTSQEGELFGTTQMQGKISIVDFIFTNCRSACPVMTPNMAQLYEAFKNSGIVQFVSISVDPERDTEEVLKQYAKDHGVTNDAWAFLRADINEVIKLSERIFMLAAANLPMGHSTKFVLVDENLKIRGYFDGMNDESVAVLKDHITALAKELQ